MANYKSQENRRFDVKFMTLWPSIIECRKELKSQKTTTSYTNKTIDFDGTHKYLQYDLIFNYTFLIY